MKFFKKALTLFLFLFFLFFFYFFVGKAPKPQEIKWGVVFSQKHATLLGLDWKEVYQEILNDLKVKNLKIITHWDLIEPQNNNFNFEDLDWKIKNAKDSSIILVVGMKTGRWPECHIPDWAKNLNEKEREKEILELLKKIVEHYKDEKSIVAWQIENEPFFPFGECPKIRKNFVKKEFDLVRSLDKRPLIFADSGEFSFWFEAAKFGDIVGTTLHRNVYFKEIKRYISYPFPPVYYWRKAKLIDFLFGKKVINVELQAEPWCKNLLYDCPPEEQKITMDLEKFEKNINFAKKTGLDVFYFWGVEWWYWQKKRGEENFWQKAKDLFTTFLRS